MSAGAKTLLVAALLAWSGALTAVTLSHTRPRWTYVAQGGGALAMLLLVAAFGVDLGWWA